MKKSKNIKNTYLIISKNKITVSLTGVTQWIEHWPVDRKVASPILHQGTLLGRRPGPQRGAGKRQPIYVSLAHQCFSPSLTPSLKLNN